MPTAVYRGVTECYNILRNCEHFRFCARLKDFTSKSTESRTPRVKSRTPRGVLAFGVLHGVQVEEGGERMRDVGHGAHVVI